MAGVAKRLMDAREKKGCSLAACHGYASPSRAKAARSLATTVTARHNAREYGENPANRLQSRNPMAAGQLRISAYRAIGDCVCRLGHVL